MSPAVAPVPNTAFAWPSGVRGALSLTFDDSRPSQIEQGVPLFDRFGVHATFYVMPATVSLRQDDWRRAVAAGHEAGGHTQSHPCTCNFGFVTSRPSGLEEMSLDQMEAELEESNAQIEQLVGVRPVSFAYPCGQKFVGRGERLQSYVPLVARHYLTGRGWRDEYFNAPDRCDLAQLAGVEFDGLDFEQVRPQIDQAAQTGNWLVLAGHDIGRDSRRQMTKTSTLEALCAYCKDPANGVWIDTVGTIGAYIRRIRAPE
jgi:peptidoglycan/xylan/chitin deacetylase (PgdA/CDA1 family)